MGPDFRFERGHPLPLGATVLRGGVNFSVFSEHATSVHLVIFLPEDPEEVVEFPLDPRYNRTGNVWHCFLDGLNPGVQYGYRMGRNPNRAPLVDRFDPNLVLLDPYAKSLGGAPRWGEGVNRLWRSEIVDDAFDWENDQPLNVPLYESIIYELHVRGFTCDPSAGAHHPGRFLGLTEKIPYLQQLGITAVELMPVFEFDEIYNRYFDPETGERLKNFWGYDPIGFFAPKAGYSGGDPVREFKEMVKRFHAAGIEVILDVVFNHTGEGDTLGPTRNFRGLDNRVYYILDPVTGEYRDYSGCGNTLNCNHPVVRNLILDCLHYWVTEMHVDGFRFDLASILGRGRDGSVLANPPLLEHIAADPVLANTKLIAEAWDAAGLYQVGSFPAWGRWAEWNGKFRDDVRRFVKGDPDTVRALALRLSGSPDLYAPSGRRPFHSINFVTCHDGFTLADLVSYNHKHNHRNGQQNRDGNDDNCSWNHGVEGPTEDPDIARLRVRQMKNLATLLLFADGVPMITAGDERARTQHGNNNPYCQDNAISWVNWDPTPLGDEMYRFFQRLIRFRQVSPLVGRMRFAPDEDEEYVHMDWHGVKLGKPDFGENSHSLAVHLHNGYTEVRQDVYLIANAWVAALDFELPAIEGHEWRRLVDTWLEADTEILEPGDEAAIASQASYRAEPRSVVVLVAKPL